MTYVIVICGFLGGWLLFAGPIWQATIELQEEQLDQDAFHQAKQVIPPSDPVSRWWLLVPPVFWVKTRRRSTEYRDAVMKALPDGQAEQAINFLNKANGWFIVAGGAFLIGVKETWELCELFEWPLWVFIALVAVATALAIGNAAGRDHRTKQARGSSAPTAADAASGDPSH